MAALQEHRKVLPQVDFSAGLRKAEPQVGELVLVRGHKVNRLHHGNKLVGLAHKVEPRRRTRNRVPHDKRVRRFITDKLDDAFKRTRLLHKANLHVLELVLLEERPELRLDAVPYDPSRGDKLFLVLLRKRRAYRLAVHAKVRHRLDVGNKACTGTSVEARHSKCMYQFISQDQPPRPCNTQSGPPSRRKSAPPRAKSAASSTSRQARTRGFPW